MNSEEDSSDSEQRVADGASIQLYQYEPEDGDNPMTDSDPADDHPEDDPRLGDMNWQVAYPLLHFKDVQKSYKSPSVLEKIK